MTRRGPGLICLSSDSFGRVSDSWGTDDIGEGWGTADWSAFPVREPVLTLTVPRRVARRAAWRLALSYLSALVHRTSHVTFEIGHD